MRMSFRACPCLNYPVFVGKRRFKASLQHSRFHHEFFVKSRVTDFSPPSAAEQVPPPRQTAVFAELLNAQRYVANSAIGLIVTGAMAAVIAVIVPWYCRVLGLVMGIWALVVLHDNQAKHAFA